MTAMVETGTRPLVIVPGGNGFIGRFLREDLTAHGYDVVVLARSPVASTGHVRQVRWDGRTLGDWTAALEGARAVVNLAGRSVNCRYNERNRGEIFDSRVDSTRVLGEAIARCTTPPPVWLNQSTATIYKHSFDRPMDEATGEIRATPEAKDAFSIDVARAWEKALEDAPTPATRKVALRTAVVFGWEDGSMFRVLRLLARWGLGGPVAGGGQYMSWIHEDDFSRAVEWLIDCDEFSGAVNVGSPNPVPYREMMRVIRQACGMPVGLPATRGMLEVAAFFHRTEAELVIKSRRVVPGRLQAAGFQFRFPSMEGAVADIERRIRTGASFAKAESSPTP